MTAAQVLVKAAKLVATTGNTDHGPVRKNMGLVAELWSAYFGIGVAPADVALCLGPVKMARARTGAPLPDHFVDMAGYAAIAGELTLGEAAAAAAVDVAAPVVVAS